MLLSTQKRKKEEHVSRSFLYAFVVVFGVLEMILIFLVGTAAFFFVVLPHLKEGSVAEARSAIKNRLASKPDE